MSTVLIVAESQPDGHLRKATLNALAAGKDLARKTGAALHLAVLGENPSALAEQLKPYGAAFIHTIASPAFAHYVAESYAPAVAALASSIGADFVGAAATAQGRDSRSPGGRPSQGGDGLRGARLLGLGRATSRSPGRCGRAASSPT